MPRNNNQKAENAAARMANLPMVRSAWTTLSVLYKDTKRSHPNLKTMCEAVENRVVVLSTMATDKISPVMVKLEPQIFIANNLACKSLDWLESTFPLLQAPTEEIVAIAKDKMHGAQEVVSVAACGTMDCIHHNVENVIDKIRQAESPVLERAIHVAGVGLDQALDISEALMDRMLPPAERDKENEARLVGRYESSPRTVRLASVSTNLCKRTYKAIETFSSSPGLVQTLQMHLSAWIQSLQGLPRYLQHQAVVMILFLSQMYTLGFQTPRPIPTEDLSSDTGPDTQKDLMKVNSQQSPSWRQRLHPPSHRRACRSCEADRTAKSCLSP